MLLLLPALLYLAVMTQAPFIVTLWYSVHKWISTSPELGQGSWAWPTILIPLIRDPTFRDAVVNWLVITLGIVVPSLVLGLAFALLLHRKLPLARAGALTR